MLSCASEASMPHRCTVEFRVCVTRLALVKALRTARAHLKGRRLYGNCFTMDGHSSRPYGNSQRFYGIPSFRLRAEAFAPFSPRKKHNSMDEEMRSAGEVKGPGRAKSTMPSSLCSPHRRGTSFSHGNPNTGFVTCRPIHFSPQEPAGQRQ